MRMWMISPDQLCRQHLLGEHSELHKFRHVFVKGWSIAGRRGQIEPQAMEARHNQLADEMLWRGFRHESPYVQPDLSAYDLSGFVVDVEASGLELRRRCVDCRAQKRLVENREQTRRSYEHL